MEKFGCDVAAVRGLTGGAPCRPRGRGAAICRRRYFAVGMTNSAPLAIEPGQRCITALYLV